MVTVVPKDRRAGLIVFGIVQVLVALGCLLLLAVTVAVFALGERLGIQGQARMDVLSVLSAALLYGGLAVFFGCTGIGSILGRRWARALTLMVSTIWLATGIAATVMLAFMMPRLIASAPGPGLETGAVPLVLVIVLGSTALFLVVLPGALVLFYRSPHVKATCERLDPVPRWTDDCPPSVLGMSALFAYSGLSVLLLLARPVFPVFGWLLTGGAAMPVILAVGIGSVGLAYAVLQRKPWAWWTTVALSVVGSASGIVTALRINPVDIATALTPQSAGASEQLLSSLGKPLLVGVSLVSVLAWFGFLIYVRRFFEGPGPVVEPAPGARADNDWPS